MVVAVLGYGRRGWVKNDLLNSNWFMIGVVLDRVLFKIGRLSLLDFSLKSLVFGAVVEEYHPDFSKSPMVIELSAQSGVTIRPGTMWYYRPRRRGRINKVPCFEVIRRHGRESVPAGINYLAGATPDEAIKSISFINTLVNHTP